MSGPVVQCSRPSGLAAHALGSRLQPAWDHMPAYKCCNTCALLLYESICTHTRMHAWIRCVATHEWRVVNAQSCVYRFTQDAEAVVEAQLHMHLASVCKYLHASMCSMSMHCSTHTRVKVEKLWFWLMFMALIKTTVAVTLSLQHAPGWQVWGNDEVIDSYTLSAAYIAIIKWILRQLSWRKTTHLTHDVSGVLPFYHQLQVGYI